MPFEQGRQSVLAASLPVGGSAQVVLELFDKPQFTDADKRLVSATSEVAAELLRQALAERQTSRLLFDAVAGALKATEGVSETLTTPPPVGSRVSPPKPDLLEQLKRGFAADANAVTDAETGLRLIEAVRELAVRHGPPAVDHCVRVVQGVKQLLDQTQG
jgi:two-component system, NtrC family, nitrogen regulation response regulator NtrX